MTVCHPKGSRFAVALVRLPDGTLLAFSGAVKADSYVTLKPTKMGEHSEEDHRFVHERYRALEAKERPEFVLEGEAGDIKFDKDTVQNVLGKAKHEVHGQSWLTGALTCEDDCVYGMVQRYEQLESECRDYFGLANVAYFAHKREEDEARKVGAKSKRGTGESEGVRLVSTKSKKKAK